MYISVSENQSLLKIALDAVAHGGAMSVFNLPLLDSEGIPHNIIH